MPNPDSSRRAFLSRGVLGAGGLGLAGLVAPREAKAAPPSNGSAQLNAANTFTTGPQTFLTGSAGNKGVVVRGTLNQSANLQEWQSITQTALLSVTPNGTLSAGVTPGTPYRAFQIQPAIPGRGPWLWEVGDTIFNGVIDPGAYFGYNTRVNGTTVVPGEPGWTVGLEANYNDGSKNTMEAYLQYTYENGARYFRPWFVQINRDANTLSAFEVLGNPFNIKHPDGPSMVQVYKNNFVVVSADGGSDTRLNVQAGVSRTAVLNLGYNAAEAALSLFPDSPASARLRVGGRTVLRIWGNPKGAPGQALSVGTLDNSGIGVFDVADSAETMKGLVVRGKATQQANLQEWQRSDSNAVASVDPVGNIRSATGIGTKHEGAATPADGQSGDIRVGDGKLWVNDAGVWKSVPLGE